MDTPTNPPPPTSRGTLADPAAPGFYGPFVVLEKLGEGGMGAVYLAEDTKLRRQVAIKTMRAELAADPVVRRRFEGEARAVAAVEHDHIVPILHVGEAADGTPFIVMPYLKGEPLDRRLKRERAAPVPLILQVAREVAEGLAAAHAAGLIHRDIKPANIWLEGDPTRQVRRCRILDFGLAKPVGAGGTGLTAAGAVVGTPAYMAPEQARGAPTDARTDLWSLGVTLYRMAAGRRPFVGPSPVAVLVALSTEEPPPIAALRPDLPPLLVALIEQLLRKDPAGRPQTAAEVAERAHRLTPEAEAPRPRRAKGSAGEGTGAADPRPLVPAPAGPVRNRWPLWLVPGVAGLALLCGLLAAAVRHATADGMVAVEFADAGAAGRFKSGRLVLYDSNGKERYAVAPGDRERPVAAGKYALKLEGVDGLALEASELTVHRGVRATVRLVPGPRKSAPRAARGPDAGPEAAPDPDRSAALYVLSAGGTVRVNESGRDIKDVGDLPSAPFRLTEVSLPRRDANAPETPAGFGALAGCRNLTGLTVLDGHVGPGAFAHFAGHTKLSSLHLSGVQVTDAALVHFRECQSLINLRLTGTQVTDTGARAFALNTKVIGKVRHESVNCLNLAALDLTDTPVGDGAVEAFRRCPRLGSLTLTGTGVTDPGLVLLKDHRALHTLNLSRTAVTDAGLPALAGVKALVKLDLRDTRVTGAGVAVLKASLPTCRIEWSGGVLEPTEK